MTKLQTFCNRCGKEFNVWDKDNGFSCHTAFGYGSKRDGDFIDLDLCCECMDKVVDNLVAECKHNPINEGIY